MPYDVNQHACFEYLKAFESISLPSKNDYRGKDRREYTKLINHLKDIKSRLAQNQGAFDSTHDYQSLYTKLHELAAKISVKENPQVVLSNPMLGFHQQFFILLYENDSKLYEKINQELIHDAQNQIESRKRFTQSRLKEQGIKRPGFFQFGHPENWANKLFSGLLGLDYNPLKRTNVPYVAFKGNAHEPTLLRMGTQIQGRNTVQGAFENYLGAKQSAAKQFGSDKDIHHVYINLLKRDLKNQPGKFERYFERIKTLALEALNKKPLGARVITLPADSAAFFQGFSKRTAKSLDKNKLFEVENIKQQLISSIKNNEHDFNIPDDVKAILFKNGLEEEVSRLLEQSAHFVLGSPPPTKITAEKRQALVFDFIKYGLTQFIAEKLNPDTMNISCKDAIDRGGVHALWFECRRRMERGDMMSEKEFNMHLDASALLVKGRPVNDHRVLIWNVLNQSFISNPKAYAKAPWVADWLVNNYPVDKKVESLENKSKLSPKDIALLSEYASELREYIKKIQPLKSVASIPEISPILETVPAFTEQRRKELSPLRGTTELSSHLDPIPEPVLEQTHCQLDSLHRCLEEQQKQGNTITKVKRREHEGGGSAVSFTLNAQRPVKVIAKSDNPDQVTYYAKRNIPLNEYEAFARTFAMSIVASVKPHSVLNFSSAPEDKKPLLKSAFTAVIQELIQTGKLEASKAPLIMTDKPPKSQKAAKETLTI